MFLVTRRALLSERTAFRENTSIITVSLVNVLISKVWFAIRIVVSFLRLRVRVRCSCVESLVGLLRLVVVQGLATDDVVTDVVLAFLDLSLSYWSQV